MLESQLGNAHRLRREFEAYHRVQRSRPVAFRIPHHLVIIQRQRLGHIKGSTGEAQHAMGVPVYPVVFSLHMGGVQLQDTIALWTSIRLAAAIHQCLLISSSREIIR